MSDPLPVLGLAALLVVASLAFGWIAWARPLARVRQQAMHLHEALAQATAARDAASAAVPERDALRGEVSALKSRLAAADAGAEARDRAHAEAMGEQRRVQAEALAERDRVHTEMQAEQRRAQAEALAERDRVHDRQLQAMREEFQRLASEALERAQKHFAEQADETLKLHRTEAARNLGSSREAMEKLISPMTETLARYDEQLRLLERKREQAYGSLSEQLQAVASGQQAVRSEAGRLVAALRSSARTAGAWGEAQLRNVLEMAGLREGIDFTLQTSTTTADGARLRPDAVLRLPGGRELVIDSKCSLADYLAASDATTEDARKAALARHAAAVRAHAKSLGSKAYWNEFARAADFVVMFLPGENFLSAALEHDLDLLRWALDQRILLAGPTNLLAIARIVSMVWRQEKIADEARAVGALGADLYASLATMAEHVDSVGRNIAQAGSAYNRLVGSLERNVLPKARRFPDLGVDMGKKAIPQLEPVEEATRQIQAPELLDRKIAGLPPADID